MMYYFIYKKGVFGYNLFSIELMFLVSFFFLYGFLFQKSMKKIKCDIEELLEFLYLDSFRDI